VTADTTTDTYEYDLPYEQEDTEPVNAALQTLIEWAEGQGSPYANMLAWHWLQKRVDDFYRHTIAEYRAAAVRAAYADGYNEVQIGEMLGVTRARINQITRR
jgi:DNA-directed RNA polymerase specialized sigma subunit